MKLAHKKQLLQKRRWRIRKKVKGTAERPRLTVRFTNKHIHVQVIDDTIGKTAAAASSVGQEEVKGNVAGAEALGKQIAEKAAAAGITTVVFDRAGRRYHGVVKAFADAARAGGLVF